MDTFPYTPHPNVPDDEFDAFLTDINSDPRMDFDHAAYSAGVEARLEVAKAEAGYTALYEDDERTALTYAVFLNECKDADPNSFDSPEKIAKIAMAMLNAKEITALAKIKIVVGFSELRLLSEPYSAEIEYQDKAGLYTNLLIVQQIDASDPIMTILNKMIPGPVLTPDDFKLQPFILAAVEEMANSELQDKEIAEFSLDVLAYVGVDPDDDSQDNNQLKSEALSIAIFGRSKVGETNAQANRLARINEIVANSKHLTPEIVQKLIQFVEERYPLE